ncbi:MAG: hypothetical protein R2941_14895 [Desulfobacterales bacterium]
MLKLDIPFMPDSDYLRFVNENRQHIHSVYFSLFRAELPDARHKFRYMDTETLGEWLQKIRGPKKYALLNSRFFHPAQYQNADFLRGTGETLDILIRKEVLDGIVFCDFYYLQALSDAVPETASQLEAVPGVNCLYDSFEKLSAVMEIIRGTAFRMPGKIIADRSLNRNPDRLAKMISQCRKSYPKTKIALLANEGCLYQCPFKPAHDAHIALLSTHLPVDTFEMNRTYGCMRHFRKNPWRLLTSPFIRPEDAHKYDADLLKICGRTLGPRFLMKTVAAYIQRQFAGSLPELLDTAEWMSEEYFIPNHELPDDFFSKVTSCAKECESCGYCRNLFDRLARKKEFRIRDLRADAGH